MKGGYDTDPVWSPDGSKLAWISMERDGYEADKQRLMIAYIDWEDSFPRAWGITDVTENFKYNAAGPVWSDDSKSICFNSLTEGLQGIYKAKAPDFNAPVNAKIKPAPWQIERITGEEMWNDFGSPFHIADGENDTKTYYTTWCSMDFPTELVAVTVGGEKTEYTPITHENEHILSQFAEHETEARWLKTVDGKDMLTWVLYPPQFDPSKTYPAITICLGGPQGTLSQGWSYRWKYN